MAGAAVLPARMPMNKREFDLKKQVLFVFMRRNGRCAVCGGEVNPTEVSMDREFSAPLPIDDLLSVQLMHPFCKAREARKTSRDAKAA